MTTKNDYSALTKEWALNVLCDRITQKWPGIDIAKEREVIAKKSRASLLHSVGAQWYGDVNDVNEDLMKYAFGEMSDAEQRSIRDAG